MPTRVTGMVSGLDTESLISELVKAKSTKVEKLKKEQTKANWKADKWKDLNKKLKSLQSTIGNLRWSSSYMKKTAKSSNESAVSVITGEGAMNSVQSLSVINLASSGYLTGDKMQTKDGSEATSSTLLKDLVCKDEDGNEIAGLGITGAGSFTVTANGKSTTINIDETTTIGNLTGQLNKAGVSANYDSKNQRLFVGALTSGKEADFTITANDANGSSAMSLLGINVDPSGNAATKAEYTKLANYYSKYSAMSKDDAIAEITSDVNSEIYKKLKAELTDEEDTDYDTAYDKMMLKLQYAGQSAASSYYNTGAVRLVGEDAEIELNGATFTSASNNIEVNGLTFECHAKASNITITTEDDTQGIYDMIKSFVKEYNELINELDSLYNAESVKGYEPLTDDEKDAMSDTEIEKYEDKIKGALFRKDQTLGLIFSGLKEKIAGGYEINGKKTYLSDFGIETLSYFSAADYEKSALHIDGDADDADTSGNTDKLKSMIAADPSSVVSFFTQLASDVYDKMSDLSASTTYSSFGTFYDDKLTKTNLAEYETKITEAQDKLNDYEDKYYSKFAAMETALSKMQSNQNYLSGLFSS